DMWEKYHEEYPNGLKRTSFMYRLDGQFKYREDLGGLCITCDFYGYQ
ncbi:6530_t:CDS:1, partial [Entrophospora sp. SA101]